MMTAHEARTAARINAMEETREIADKIDTACTNGLTVIKVTRGLKGGTKGNLELHGYEVMETSAPFGGVVYTEISWHTPQAIKC